jgi:hypothetical protein
VAVAIFVFLFGYSLQAKIVYVPGDAATIQEGIDLADELDTVLVSHGTYIENISILDRVVSVISAEGPLVTEIQPADPDSPVLSIYNWKAGSRGGNRDLQSHFSGFTISGGNDSPTFYLYGPISLIIRDNIFHHNIPFKIEDKAVISAQITGALEIVRNIFYSNYGVTCIQVMEGAVSIINNTFDGNRSAFLSSSDSALALNNIVSNSSGTAIDGVFGLLDYNDLWNNFADYG